MPHFPTTSVDPNRRYQPHFWRWGRLGVSVFYAVGWVLLGQSLSAWGAEPHGRGPVLLAKALDEGPVAEPEGNKPEGPAARLVTIPLPLTGDDDQTVKGTLQRAIDQLLRENANAGRGNGRPVLVLEFTPSTRATLPDGRGTDFTRALALSNFLASEEMAAVKTVAFLPRSIKGHALLAVIACEEIAMAPDAELGEAAADESPDRPVEEGIVNAYRNRATSRRTVPPALAVGWVDRRVEVHRVESEDQIDLVLGKDLPEVERERTIVDQELLIPAGVLGLQKGRQGRELGYVKYLAADHNALARVLRVDVAVLQETGGIAEQWNPIVIDINGVITPRTVKRVETLIGSEIDEQEVNWIAFRIDSTGGELNQCLLLANTIAALDPNEVRTVAYVPANASGGAALVALACDQLVMQPGASVGGGYESLPDRAVRRPRAADNGNDPRQVRPPQDRPARDERRRDRRRDQRREAEQREEIAAAISSIESTLAESTGRSKSLLAAVIDPELRVFQYTHRETAEQLLMSEAEAASMPDAQAWNVGQEITSPGKSLRLGAEAAAELGIAWRVIDSIDDLSALYGFEEELRVAEPNWVFEFIEALRSRQFAMLLLMIGFLGIYIELNMPGVGFGGFIATLAFVLFFWSRFTAGTADLLEVMLFVSGILCLLLEVFVLPGVGIFGFGGAVLVLSSLVLASQTFVIPKTAGQMAELRGSLGMLAGAFAGLVVGGIVLRRYLPHTPLFRRMQLAPATGADAIDLDNREAVADYAYLVGKIGTATTDLLPSGRAEIDGELVDVIAECDAVDRGATIQVVSARANRVLVKGV